MRKGKNKKRKDKLKCDNGSAVLTSASSFGRLELILEFLQKELWMQ